MGLRPRSTEDWVGEERPAEDGQTSESSDIHEQTSRPFEEVPEASDINPGKSVKRLLE
jgi:hypothetical protein